MGPSDRRGGRTPDQRHKRHHAPVCHLNGLHTLQYTPVGLLAVGPTGSTRSPVEQSRNDWGGACEGRVDTFGAVRRHKKDHLYLTSRTVFSPQINRVYCIYYLHVHKGQLRWRNF